MYCFRVHNQFLSHNSKRMIKFLLSFSVLSVLFTLLPFILHSLKPFLMQFFSSYYTVDKSYMFLLCNGLMVFIAMNSGLINANSKSSIQQLDVAVGDNYKSSRLDFNASEVSATVAGEIVTAAEPPQEEENSLVIAEQENALPDAQEDEEEGNEYVIIDEDGEEENSLVIIEDEEEEEGNALVIIEEEEEEEGNAIMIIDEHAAEETEELNKKCEDFIRKMKAAFCSEPRADYSLDLDNEKSLVLVN